MGESWRVFKHDAAAGAALLSLVVASGYAIVRYDHDQAASFKRQIGQQVRRDGFKTESGSDGSLGNNNVIHIGELSLGFCELSDVSAKVEMNHNNNVEDIVSYSYTPSPDFVLTFDNAAQAERELPVPFGGNC